MSVFGSNRPLAALTDTRILLMAELERLRKGGKPAPKKQDSEYFTDLPDDF